MLSIFAQQKMLAAADGPADAPAPQPVHAQMKRKHRSKSSRSKHAQRGTERGYTQVARDAVRIAGMIEDLDDWQGENARESRQLQKRRGQVAAQIHVVNCRARALADKEGQLEEQLAQASSRRPNRQLLSSLSSCLLRRRCPTAFRPAFRITPISHPTPRTEWLPLLSPRAVQLCAHIQQQIKGAAYDAVAVDATRASIAQDALKQADRIRQNAALMGQPDWILNNV